MIEDMCEEEEYEVRCEDIVNAGVICFDTTKGEADVFFNTFLIEQLYKNDPVLLVDLMNDVIGLIERQRDAAIELARVHKAGEVY